MKDLYINITYLLAACCLGFINPVFGTMGSISPSTQSIYVGDAAGTITIGGPDITGAGCTYQWYSSTNNVDFYPVSGATALSYSPGSLTETRYYKVRVQCGATMDWTPTATVNVIDHLVVGSITPVLQTINFNTSPGQLTSTAATEGTGSYVYQWQQRYHSGTFADTAGQNGLTFTPSAQLFTRYFRLKVTSGSEIMYTTEVTVKVNMKAGTVSPSSQAVNYNVTPAALTAMPAGGDIGTYNYQWQSSTNNSTWTDISGATTLSYTPAYITGTRYYRLFVSYASSSAVSNVVTVTGYPQVTTTVSPASLNINYNTSPGQLTNTVSGGNGVYTYQWQNSSNGSTWANIPAATGQNYTPGVMNASAYYRVITTSNGVAVTSNSVFVNVYPALAAGTISPVSGSVLSGNSPGNISGTLPTGGNGTYTYQWQSAPDGTTWTNIAGATSQNCTPGGITATTHYRRAVTSNGVTVYSNVAVFTVYLPVTMANITPDKYEVYFYGAHTFMSSPASGGNGTYAYQWQSSANGSTWSDIAGANTLEYTPSGLSATTWFRLKGTSAGTTGYSNAITAVIPLNGGIININVPSVASGGAVTLGSTQLASGSDCSAYTYQWQSSNDEYTWTNISGATVSNITKTTWFRRLATCNSKTASSNIVRVRVKDPAAQLIPNGVTAAPAGTQPAVVMPAYTGIDPNNLNYVRTRSFAKPGITDVATADAQTGVFDVRQVTVYMDGLGRPIQTVAKQSTPDLADLITTNFYDQYGREQQQYLPYADNGTTGNFRTDAATKQPAFYNTMYSNQEGYYYKKTIYEASPLNKVLKTTAPGRSWTGQAVGTGMQDRTNTRSDSVVIWKINLDTGRIPIQGGYYMPGTLYVGETTDEHDNKVIEFKDLEGRLILRKTQLSDQLNTGNTGWLLTYYVYDDLDRLRFVLPPKAVDLIKSNWVISSAVASELCYLYRYDGQGRMIVKKLPAADSVEMVYDKRDRLIASRDGNLKFRQFWNVKYYDTQNRERMSGLLYFGYNREQMQTSVDASAFDPANSFPFLSESGILDLIKTFYDDYSYAGSVAYNTADIAKPQASGNLYAEALPAAASKATRGMITGRRARVDYGDQFLMSTVYYDDKGRTIQTAEDNMRGGRETTNNLYAFNGKLLSSYLRHTNPQSVTTPQTTLLSMYHYDAGGRIDSVKKRLNDNIALQQTVAVNEYDELGNLKIKRLSPTGASTQLESLNYDYNIRGWMTGLNKSFVNTPSNTSWFGMELNYDYGFGVQELNGNIAGTKWKSRSDGIARSYGFDYDNTNRFITANFTQQNQGTTTWLKNIVDFSVSGLSYDQNGNIQAMKQIGMNGVSIQTIDSLKYGYIANSNRLSFVSDKVNNAQSILGDFKEITNNETADYLYDPSGNMCRDNNKDIDSVFYNHLNLPSIVYLKDVKAKIFYQYDGSGRKVSKIVWDSTGTTPVVRITYYMNGLVYQKDTLEFIAHEEGRIRPIFRTGQPVSYAYDYFVKDHLGSTRMILSTKTDTAVYAATMETAASEVENALFNNIDNTRSTKPVGYPVDNTTNPNTYVAKLNAVNGQKIGPSLVLRVMANDTIRISVKALYKNAGANTSSSTSASMVSSILQAFSGSGISQGVHNSSGSGASITMFTSANYDQLKTQDNSQNLADKPKAYLNYVLFDDMFNMVTENSGVKQVQGQIDSLATLSLSNTTIKKTGFLYIYVSNESGQDVFFDNLIVTHTSGALLEETHYYPYGLTMAGISSQALKGTGYVENRIRYHGKELQQGELVDGSGINWYDYKNRFYDQQIGRFFTIDPLADKFVYFSTYQFAGNEVPNAVDIDGMEPWYTRDGNLATGIGGPYDPAVMNKRGLYTAEQIAQMKNALPPDPNQPTVRQANDCRECVEKGRALAREKERQKKLYETQEGQSYSIVSSALETAAWEYAGVKVASVGGKVLSKIRGSVWELAPAARGFAIERMLGGNLPSGFPVIDKITNGVATSIKSIDLTLSTYRKSSNLLSKLKSYVNALGNFTGGTRGNMTIEQGIDFTTKSLEVAINPTKASAEQWEAILKAVEYANKEGITIQIRFVK